MPKLKVLSRFDAYPRAEEHLTHRTLSGAIVSICGVCLMAVLFVSELRHFTTIKVTQELTVDSTRANDLDIRVNISLPALPCSIVSVDSTDASGSWASDVMGELGIRKERLNAHGDEMGKYEPPEGAQDLMQMFRALDMQIFGGGHMIQLVSPQTVTHVREAVRAHEGCRVHGTIRVPRVSGSFHFSVHAASFDVLQQVFADVRRINVSHVVHKLAFGPEYEGMINPLDGFVRYVGEKEDTGTFKYFLKLVPTTYTRLDGKWKQTHQFSVTEYFSAAKGKEITLPSVYFSYDFSPITVAISERRRSFLHFLTRMSAVVGGMFAVTGMLDRLIYGITNMVAGTPY